MRAPGGAQDDVPVSAFGRPGASGGSISGKMKTGAPLSPEVADMGRLPSGGARRPERKSGLCAPGASVILSALTEGS